MHFFPSHTFTQTRSRTGSCCFCSRCEEVLFVCCRVSMPLQSGRVSEFDSSDSQTLTSWVGWKKRTWQRERNSYISSCFSFVIASSSLKKESCKTLHIFPWSLYVCSHTAEQVMKILCWRNNSSSSDEVSDANNSISLTFIGYHQFSIQVYELTVKVCHVFFFFFIYTGVRYV